MFSSLGPLFKTVFRQAEETDTRQAIRREEKEQGQKQREQEEDNRISIDLWEDKSSVSVEALQSFLITFIKGGTYTNTPETSNKPNQSVSQETGSKPVIEKKQAQTTVAQRAASAYEAMNAKTAPQKPVNEGDSSKIPAADRIQSAEARQIYKLIDDLESLKERGVAEIFIEPADSFVESLAIAIASKKRRLGI